MGTGRLPERLPSGSNPTWPYRIPIIVIRARSPVMMRVP